MLLFEWDTAYLACQSYNYTFIAENCGVCQLSLSSVARCTEFEATSDVQICMFAVRFNACEHSMNSSVQVPIKGIHKSL